MVSLSNAVKSKIKPIKVMLCRYLSPTKIISSETLREFFTVILLGQSTFPTQTTDRFHIHDSERYMIGEYHKLSFCWPDLIMHSLSVHII